MTAEDLARVVADMRHAQKDYFRTKSQAALRESKALEAMVDRCCAHVLGGQGTLFDEEETT